MHVDLGHATTAGHPVEFPQPDFRSAFTKEQKQGRILRQCVGQFNVAVPDFRFWKSGRGARHPEWKNGSRVVILRLERVCVEGGGIVLDVQIMKPLQVVQHEAGTKSLRAPFFQIAVDAPRLFEELFAPPVKFPVVTQIMDADFKPVSHQFLAQCGRDTIFAFGNEIERGTEAERLFELHQLAAFGQAVRTFDVVGEHQRKFFPVRPARPAGGQPAGDFVDRPGLCVMPPLHLGDDPPRPHPQAPRQIRFEAVIKSAA